MRVGRNCFAVSALEWREANVFIEYGDEECVHQTLESLGIGCLVDGFKFRLLYHHHSTGNTTAWVFHALSTSVLKRTHLLPAGHAPGCRVPAGWSIHGRTEKSQVWNCLLNRLVDTLGIRLHIICCLAIYRTLEKGHFRLSDKS